MNPHRPAARATAKTARRAAALVFTGLALSACGGAAGIAVGSAEQIATELESNRDLWDGAEIDDYTYVYELSCFCAPEWDGPILVTVIDDVIVSAEALEDPGIEVDLDRLQTVEELFDRAAEEIESAEVVSVAYDEAMGYPTAIIVDEDEDVTDDEYGLHISDLTLISD